MDSLISTILGLGLAISPLVMLVVETVKSPKIIPSRWLPLVSILIGIGVSMYIGILIPDTGSLAELGLAGVVSGTVASGIYNQVTKGSSTEVSSGIEYPTEKNVMDTAVDKETTAPETTIDTKPTQEEPTSTTITTTTTKETTE